MVAQVVWVYGPLVCTVALSFVEWNLTTGSPVFVGFRNYTALFVQPEFAAAAGRTLLLVLCIAPFATVAPIGVAITLWKRGGRAAFVYRSLMFLPVILAPVATAVSWRFVLNPVQGILARVSALFAVPTVNWLGGPHTALPTIALITAGKVFGLTVLLYGAALEGIDRRCLAAARVDGVGEWDITRHVVVPQLGRTTALMALLCVVLSGQWAFTNVAVLTQGGPEGATDNVYYRLYTYGFTFFDTGVASAGSVVVIIALGLPLAVHAWWRRTTTSPAKAVV